MRTLGITCFQPHPVMRIISRVHLHTVKKRTYKNMTRMEGSSTDGGESKGEMVCAIFMERLLGSAIEKPIELATRPNKVTAFGKLGLCCRRFRLFTKDPRVIDIFDYLIEYMCSY